MIVNNGQKEAWVLNNNTKVEDIGPINEQKVSEGQ
jgi:hypothetical protein